MRMRPEDGGRKKQIPGAKANMFGRVLLIQKGIWNWRMERSIKLVDATSPKRRSTASRMHRRPYPLNNRSTRRAKEGDSWMSESMSKDGSDLISAELTLGGRQSLLASLRSRRLVSRYTRLGRCR
jgi:hypothetical protein